MSLLRQRVYPWSDGRESPEGLFSCLPKAEEKGEHEELNPQIP
jgi:hypothetical protein